MLTPDEIAKIRLKWLPMDTEEEASPEGQVYVAMRRLCDHIAAQSEQLRQAQAEGAALRTDLHQALRQWNMYAVEVRHLEEDPLATAADTEAQMYQAIVTRLTSTFAFTAYAERVARMEEALERAGRYAAIRAEQGDELAADLVRSIAGALAGEGEKRG